MECIRLFGVDILNSNTPTVLDYFREHLKEASSKAVGVGFINAHGVNILHQDEAYRAALTDMDWVLNDGVGLDIAAKLQGYTFEENLNGTDLMPKVIALCSEIGARVFFLGTTEQRLEKATSNLQARHPDLQVAGLRNGFFAPEENDDVVRSINESGADVLLVALGNPKQELWIHENLAGLNVKLAFAIGAYIDFESGEVVRAPKLFQALKIEWLFRLLQEPRRLWNRYIIGNMKFLYRAFRERKRGE